MHRISYVALCALAVATTAVPAQRARPTLIVVITVDQMRADYLQRFDSQLTGGFRRLADGGAIPECDTGRRERNTRRANEQRGTQSRFELTNLLTQRRLRDVESRGRSREAQLLGDGREVPEVPQFDYRNS